MTRYCVNNVICLDKQCDRPHYKTFVERMKLSDLFLTEAKHDMDSFMEPLKHGRPTCRYHLLCFERDCPYNHSGYSLDGRKILIKKFKTFNNNLKAKNKIDKDIADIRAGKSVDWNDM